MNFMRETKEERVWIRVAGHAKMIRDRAAHHWRCFLRKEMPEISLRSFDVTGEVTPQNFIAGTNPDGDDLGLIAWLDLFGDFCIDEDDVLHVVLRQPE